MDGTGDHHIEWDKPSSKKPNFAGFHLSVESRLKMMMILIKI
jgi:hypothetical protein